MHKCINVNSSEDIWRMLVTKQFNFYELHCMDKKYNESQWEQKLFKISLKKSYRFELTWRWVNDIIIVIFESTVPVMFNFTRIIMKLLLIELMNNRNIHFPGTLKISLLFLEQLWTTPPWEFWELGLMIQIWFAQGIIYTAKVCDCWYTNSHMYVHM